MSYSVKKPPKDLVEKIKNRHPEATIKETRQFVHVFNGAIKDGDSETRAFAKAWGILNQNEKLKSSHVETNKKETIKQVKKTEKKDKRKKKSSLNKISTKTKLRSFLVDLVILSLANDLDSIGLHKEANYIESLIEED